LQKSNKQKFIFIHLHNVVVFITQISLLVSTIYPGHLQRDGSLCKTYSANGNTCHR